MTTVNMKSYINSDKIAITYKKDKYTNKAL